MIRTLRRKFILVNMLLVSLVLLMVFGVFMASSAQRLKDQSLLAMRAALMWGEEGSPLRPEIAFPLDGSRRPSSGQGAQRSLLPVFTVTVEDGVVTGVTRLAVTDDPAQLETIVQLSEQLQNATDLTDIENKLSALINKMEAGGESPLAINLACKPNLTALAVPGVAGNSPFDEARDGNDARSADATAQACALTMKGQQVFKFGVTTICDAVNGLCEQAGIEVSAIDHFIFHQANERILAAASARLGLDDTKVARTLTHTGNISSACIPYTIDTLARNGELKQGELIALVGFGAGLDTGSCLMRWS